MSKSAKLSVSELLRLACIYAERDQEELLCAHEHLDDEESERVKQEIRDFLAQLRYYRLKRWGKTRLEKWMDDAKPVSIKEYCQGGEACK